MGKQNLYHQVMIRPHHAGFGMWENQGEDSDGYACMNDIFNEVEVVELEDGAELPEGAEDIRGKVYNEPDMIFCAVHECRNGRNRWIEYYGINVREVEDEQN